MNPLTPTRVYLHGLPLIPVWISKHMPNKVWDEITDPFSNFNGATVEVWEWISNLLTRFTFNPCIDK